MHVTTTNTQVAFNTTRQTGASATDRFLAEAQKFIGQPYEWGGGHDAQSGIQPVDCSGLIGQAARAMGLDFEGRARDMQDAVKQVDMSDLKPGDLVFKGDPATHVGIYMGDGKVLEAPRTGEDVQITDLNDSWTSAGRIPALADSPASTPAAATAAAMPGYDRDRYQTAAVGRRSALGLPGWPIAS